MYTINDVKKVQDRLLEMAVVIRDILESNNIPYFITYGTLLGAVRHQGFIPWDDDFDYYLFDDSYEDAMAVLKAELPIDMFLENWDTEPMYFHSWAHVKDVNSYAVCDLFPQDGKYTHHGISVDLYRLKKISDNSVPLYRLEENIAYLNRRKAKSLITSTDYAIKIHELNRVRNQFLNNNTEVGSNKMVFATVLPILEKMQVDDILPLKDYIFEDHLFKGPNNADIFLSSRYGDYMQLPSEDERKPHYSSVVFL